MGNFLVHLKKDAQPTTNPLLNNSISKLREYHGSFKSVCDTFSIDLTEYEQIFGSNETMFQIWDTDQNGLINALELFSGLIIFADSKFEEKVRFLFDLFDFNELNSLWLTELEFLILSCANATYKILGIAAEVNEEDISQFLNNYFADDSRINISQMLKWCVKTPEICEFFALIKKDPPELRVGATKSKMQRKNDTLQSVFTKEFGKKLLLPDDPRPFFDNKPLGNILGKHYDKKLEWISSLTKKVFSSQGQAQRDVFCKMSWVYGFRGRDVRRPLSWIKVNTGQDKATNEKFLYFTACIVVLYFPKINEQKHYLEHESEIISLAVASNLSLVATGEYAEYPAIHIWDSNTLQNLGVIKGVHQKGVHLITFFSKDQLIASCGLRQNSPILIYSIKDFSLILSTCVNEFAIDLITIRNFVGTFSKEPMPQPKKQIEPHKDPFSIYENSFVICTLKEILLFQYYEGHFLTKEVYFSMYDLSSPLTCATSLRINPNNPYLKAYQDESHAAILIITGHQDGSVYLWENFQTYELIVKCKDQIVCLTSYSHGLIIGTDASIIQLWDFTFKNKIKEIDLTTFNFKLFSYSISDIVVGGEKLLVATTEGDVVEIYLQQKSEHSNNAFINKMRANRITHIAQLSGNLNALSILERPDSEDKLVFAAGAQSMVYGFSLETHEIVDVWTIGDQITAMDCINFEDGGTVFALGTLGGRIYLRVDWEEQPQWYDCKHQINDLKFSQDTSCLVGASNDSFVYVFYLNNNDYLQMTPKKIHFEGEVPVSLDFVDDCKAFIVGTSMKNQYKIELPDLKPKNLLQENEKLNSTTWTLRYPMRESKRDQFYPIVIGGDVRVFLAAGDGGYIYFWKDREQLENNCGGFLRGHASQVSRLLMTKSQDIFFSLGSQDNTMIEWKIEFINGLNDFSRPFNEDKPSMISKQSNFSMTLQNQDLKMNIDEVFKREKDYCFFLGNISDKFKDNHLLFRATTHKMLNGLLSEQIAPFEPKDYLQKRSPPLSLHLDFVYGFLAYDKRRTLYYVHMYSMQNKKKKNITVDNAKKAPARRLLTGESRQKMDQLQQQSIMLPAHFQREMLFAKQSLLPYDESHQECQRQFVYITSRVAVVYNPLNNTQRFYEGHRFKITCVAIHPMKCFVATGESAPSPCIHIWNVFNTEPIKILKTNHRNGIYDLVFSRDSALIVSIGIDENYSVQVTNWKTETIIAFRNSGTSPICSVTFNPYNRYEFATCGYQNITIWKVDGRNLIRNRVVGVGEEMRYANTCFITCISYISYLLGDQIESDIIVGNNYGELALVACGKYIVVKERAHDKMINCLKITEILKDKVVIITSGEDEFIRIWDTKFNLINEFNIRKTGFFDGNTSTNVRNISAQSIDIFSCRQPKRFGKDDDSDPQQSVMLVGTRNGDIIEAAIQVEFSGMKPVVPQESKSSSDESDDDKEKQPYTTTETLKFNYSIYLRSHQSQVFDNKQQIDFFNKKLFFTLHPTQPIMITVGEDQKIMIWDIEDNTLLQVKSLGMTPTAVKFSPDGDHLVVGYQNSMVTVLDSRMQKNTMGKLQDRYQLPSLELLQPIKDKDTKTPVLNVEFSAKGDMLAISYDSAKSVKDAFDSKLEKEGSVVSVWMSKAFQKQQKFRGSGNQDKNLFIKYNDIKSPSIQDNYQTEKESFSVSVYFMTFSTDGQYLFIYYQLVNNQQTRVNNDPQGVYIVWDLSSNTSVKSWEPIKNIQWKRLNFPNSLYSQYQFYDNLMTITDQQTTAVQEINLANEILKVPVHSVMVDIKPFILTGSTNGDIHLVKSSCLYYNKDTVGESIHKKQMCLAKSYSAHISFVNQIEAHKSNEYLFTTGIVDECVMKWKLFEEQQMWDLDNLTYDRKQADLFTELPSKDKYKNLLKELLPIRAGIADKVKNVDDTRQPEVELKLTTIIGRKAFGRRNNLFYDYDERLIYVAGCNLIVTTLDDEEDQPNMYSQYKKFKGGSLDLHDHEPSVYQEFIKLDQSQQSSSPEISCIALSIDKKLLCAGTIETNAKLLIWDICSRTCVKSLTLNNCSMIMNIKFAYDNRHVCVNAISREYTMMVMLIDTQDSHVLGAVNFNYTIPSKIKDMEFYPSSIFKFVTCGIQHMSQWKYSGGSLTYSAMEIENPKDLVTLPQEQKEENADEKEDQKEDDEEKTVLGGTFLTVIFVQDAIITADDDGFLYVWDDQKISKKQKAHPNASILSLNSTKDSSMFVSGGMDGRVILWFLGLSEYNYIVEKIYEYSITNEDLQTALANPKNHIQSVCIGSKYILAGTRSGDIYELVRPNESDLKSLTKVNTEMVKLRINCIDHELPRVVAFSGNAEKLYSITQKGLFCVWNLQKLIRIYTKHFQRDTLTMIVCKNSPKIFIALSQEIIVLNSLNDQYTVNDKYNMKHKTAITDVKLSFDEKMLAVGLAGNQEQNARFELYDVENEEGTFKHLFTIGNLNSNIDYLDFSTDNFFLLYKDALDEIAIIDIQQQKIINTLYVEFDLEWCGDGIKHTEKAKGVHSCYTDENKIIKISRIGENSIAVTDEMGTLRIFSYPCHSGSGYMRLYTEHLNFINQCVESPDKEILVTTSEMDRCIMVWRVEKLSE